ncbi:MAG: PepSY domain-containing protein [Rhodanobacteraceae bacterium]|nr:PepSY domain-containing protein [Rhodanobacteraceae bacterium]
MNRITARPSHLAIACALVLASAAVSAKRLPDGRLPEPEENATQRYTTRGSLDANGRLQAVYSPRYVAKPAGVEMQAREYLRAARYDLGLVDPDAELVLDKIREVGALRVVRFQQVYQGVPVRDVQIDVSLAADGRVVFVANGYRVIDDAASKRVVVSDRDARDSARAALGSNRAPDLEQSELVWWVVDGKASLVYDVRLDVADVVGYWSVLVDAATGAVLRKQDLAAYAATNGTATVFIPDPISSARATYGVGGYVDSNDTDVAVLNAQRANVVLHDIDLTAGNYTLAGPWALCSAHESPSGGINACPSRANADFSSLRADQLFEFANVYHHIDTAMRYYNVTLGVAVRPSVNAGSVKFDPHGLNNDDNSHYEGGGLQRLAFGDGCVDDAEDADVIIHELGHGLHDWITGGGLSQSQGLSEGTGDYFASTYSRSFAHWTPVDPQYFWMFHWDGHNTCWNGRITDYHTDVVYPNLGSPSPHIPGQYWASCNLLAHDAIGRDKMDRAMLLGLGLTNSGSNQADAAQAVLNAMDANTGFTPSDIHAVFDAYTRGQAANGCNYPVTEPVDEGLIFRNGFDG